jgi:hypothetical protein
MWKPRSLGLEFKTPLSKDLFFKNSWAAEEVGMLFLTVVFTNILLSLLLRNQDSRVRTACW